MVKVVNINLGGHPFILNEDAFSYLESYLEALRKHFNQEEGADEIIADIEARLAELFHESLGNRKIVEIPDVKAAVQIMGQPDEFGFDTEAKEHHSNGDSSGKNQEFENKTNYKTGKRLYKNPDDKIVSGVASGLAAYFGIKDPIVIRLVFVFMSIFGGGSGIPVYIVLMLILKDAKTGKEKLEMRGEPINLDSLTKVVNEEIKNLGDSLKDFSEKQGWTKQTNKHSFKKKATTHQAFRAEDGQYNREEEYMSNTERAQWDSSEFVEQAKEASRRFGQSFELALRGLLKILKPIVMIIGAMFIAALLVAWVAIIIALVKGTPMIMMFMPSSTLIANLGLVNLIFIIFIPVIGLILLMVRLFFSFRPHHAVTPVLVTLWFLHFFSLSVVGAKIAEEFQTSFSIIENVFQNPSELKQLYIKGIKSEAHYDGYLMNSFSLFHNRTNSIWPQTTVWLDKSEDEDIHVVKTLYARGKDETEAKSNIASIPFSIEVRNDSIVIPDHFTVQAPNKFRKQSVEITVQIPENKIIHFDKDLGNILFRSKIAGSPIYNRGLRGTSISLEENKLKIVPKDEQK